MTGIRPRGGPQQNRPERPRDPVGRGRPGSVVTDMAPSRDGFSLPEGGIVFLLRVTLAVLFCFLLVVSDAALGIAGPVIVSVLYLAALLFPVLSRTLGSPTDPARDGAPPPLKGPDDPQEQRFR